MKSSNHHELASGVRERPAWTIVTFYQTPDETAHDRFLGPFWRQDVVWIGQPVRSLAGGSGGIENAEAGRAANGGEAAEVGRPRPVVARTQGGAYARGAASPGRAGVSSGVVPIA
jgi:hypothetical protein